MREYLEELCDGIDAAVFSGDVLYSDDERKELAEYISRWSNAIGEHEAIAAAEQAQQAEPVARSTGNFHGDVNGNVFCEVATAGKVIPAGTPLYARPPARQQADIAACAVCGAAVATQQQAEPVALSLPFFAYDEEVGFERFATEAEAKKFVQEGIDECRSNMVQGDAWPSEIENLCWGVVLGTTKEIKLGNMEDGSGDYYADYVLTDAAQPPAGGAPQATAEDSSVVQDAVAVPDGYALVPIEPTAQMVEAGFGRDDDNCKFWLHPAQAYRAMLASATERPK